jgi:hypothetical protein
MEQTVMADNQSHISERIREDLDKLGPEKKQRVLDVADRDFGVPAKVLPKPVRRVGSSES